MHEPEHWPDESFIEEVIGRLKEEKRVRRRLPGGGRLHIDRNVPFLCVYRRPPGSADNGTLRLVLGESSHLIAMSQGQSEADLGELVQRVVNCLADQFGAFLLVEIWAGKSKNAADDGVFSKRSRFRVFTPKSEETPAVIGHFVDSLRAITVPPHRFEVEVLHGKVSPPGLSSLLTTSQARASGALMVGLEVPPIYLDAQGEVLLTPLRLLQRKLSRALQQTFFQFLSTHTTHRPANYHSLGRRAPVKAVWEVDEQLAQISNSFRFLLAVTPVNIEAAWRQWKKDGFEKEPSFHYRWLPTDPDMLKRKLYDIRIERVEDPALANLFRDKRDELARQITMLEDRDTPRFFPGSLQVYGGVNDELYSLAQTLLDVLPYRERRDSAQRRLVKATEFAELAREEISYYAAMSPNFSAKVHVRDDVPGILVSEGDLLISTRLKVVASRQEALLQHEVGTHILTYYNGRAQKMHQLYTGLPGYDELQEGLAVLAEYLVGGLSTSRMRMLAARVVGVRALQDGADFGETFLMLHREYGFGARVAYDITMRIYRGGGFTKDAVYLRGLVKLLKYLAKGLELDPIFCGKISAEYIPVVQELQWREIVGAAGLYPRYLDDPEAQRRLALARQGLSVVELIGTK